MLNEIVSAPAAVMPCIGTFISFWPLDRNTPRIIHKERIHTYFVYFNLLEVNCPC